MYKLLQQWTSRWNIPRFSIIFEITFWVFLGIGVFSPTFSRTWHILGKLGFGQSMASTNAGAATGREENSNVGCFFFCGGCRLEQSQGGARRIGGEGKSSCVLCLSPSTRWGTEWPIGAGTFALRASSQKKNAHESGVLQTQRICVL